MKKPRPCAACIEVRDSPILSPRHVVHPRDGKPELWDVYGEAVCPTCGTRWRHNRDNRAEIVG